MNESHKFMMGDLEVDPLIREGEIVEEPDIIIVGDDRKRIDPTFKKQVVTIAHSRRGMGIAAMMGAVLVSGLAQSNVFREVPEVNTTGGRVPSPRYRPPEHDDGAAMRRAEEKRKRKAAKLIKGRP